MQTLENMKTRRSIRKYKSQMVSKDLIAKVMEAGSYAATGMNKQSPIIVAVTKKETRDKIAQVNAKIGGWQEGFDPFYGAPVILIVLADAERATAVNDGSLVLGNMMLAAHELGLGSCWIHRAKEEFKQPEWKEWLKSIGVEGDYIGVGHLALGYVDGEYPEKLARKDGWGYWVE